MSDRDPARERMLQMIADRRATIEADTSRTAEDKAQELLILRMMEAVDETREHQIEIADSLREGFELIRSRLNALETAVARLSGS